MVSKESNSAQGGSWGVNLAFICSCFAGCFDWLAFLVATRGRLHRRANPFKDGSFSLSFVSAFNRPGLSAKPSLLADFGRFLLCLLLLSIAAPGAILAQTPDTPSAAGVSTQTSSAQGTDQKNPPATTQAQ